MSTVDKIKKAVKDFATKTESLISTFIDSRPDDTVKDELKAYRKSEFKKVFGEKMADNPEYVRFRKFESAVLMALSRTDPATKTDTVKRAEVVKAIAQKTASANDLKVTCQTVLAEVVKVYGVAKVSEAFASIEAEALLTHEPSVGGEPKQIETVNE